MNKLIEAYNVAIRGTEGLAHEFGERAKALKGKTNKEIVEDITWSIIQAVGSKEALAIDTDDGVSWSTIGRAAVLAGFAWVDVSRGIRDAFIEAYPRRTWSGGYLKSVEAADKPTRKSKGKSWKSAESSINKAIAAVGAVKGPKKGKQYMEAKAKVILLAEALGMKVS